ncbi:PEP-CTERM protein-sorting domain-containing protein [Parasphingorhabdus marina DSM 22363]|uniref:PEP-CTERM protein-sorting domain-containing protein n=1 Tax=Parasphingorhabdus marina DSM 22363 TaxID=1123272 RepID=A0A1N6FPC4_9SPHN|nr:PEPxxWA-CTERM sorting domain-containing protein [Parasphingorhabdus marina]SIN97070.1 PEP-CTERM protein-sorting domain-containing protein [Parasphingorhabdus marina DSM 22363]
MQKIMQSATAFKYAVVLGLGTLPMAGVQAATIIGNQTDVEVTAFDALTGLGLTLTPFGTAMIDTGGALPVATFAITGGTVDDGTGDAVILHEGSGLTFTAGAMSVTYSDFVIDTATSVLSSTVTMNGSMPGTIDLFTFDADLNLFLTDAAAGGLTTVFGAPDLGGTQFGVANVDLAVTGAVPEPGSWMMMIGGFALVGGALRHRRRQSRALAPQRVG